MSDRRIIHWVNPVLVPVDRRKAMTDRRKHRGPARILFIRVGDFWTRFFLPKAAA
jgi:hypothetical protein